MKILNIISFSAFQLFSCIFVFGYFLGLLNNYFSDKNNYCVMTYMFEYPQFVRISLDENKMFPQYGLYAYSEGRLTEKARKMWFDGIPVLYLPGNSGSHMQARSIASLALRKALSQEYDYHFDYFTINYNEEISGLFGGVLEGQTEFASACISKILSLYKNNKYTKSVPTAVVLIGHSMGGVIAKRLLAYPNTISLTNIAVTLAAPLEAPVINCDVLMNEYYVLMNWEWEEYINQHDEIKQKKFLITIGSGSRDILVPAGLTSSNNSHISTLATAIPGVWVSPDHVSMVWCKQLVLVINRFLFDIVDPLNAQVTENPLQIMKKARQYFQANRTMVLDPQIIRNNITMQADAFWYEDNRRIYQISRPEIDRVTHLMIRLVSFPQNRFVAVQSVNVKDKDWIFGCNAKDVHHSYSKQATSLSELSRWTGSATDFGKRKLATVHLHKLMEFEPKWTHVIVKVSPTKKPVTLNVDINDLASRQLNVKLPSDLSFSKHIIKTETEPNSLYYELILNDCSAIHQAYLLYVEPTSSCQSYHVSAELHVPWAENHEYYHYFTHLKQSPMKLRLFKSNPNTTLGLESTEKVKIILLLDPKCTFTIRHLLLSSGFVDLKEASNDSFGNVTSTLKYKSQYLQSLSNISTSWYHRLAQFSRNYTPVLIPYVAGILLLAARSVIVQLKQNGFCVSMHTALMSESVKPYYALVFARLGVMTLMSIGVLTSLIDYAAWKNLELQYFTRSLLVLPAYMTALGVLNIVAAAVLIVMLFSSQLAHRLLFRIVWRGGKGLAENMATGLQKVPMVMSIAMICAVPISCGAASLVAGAAFYAFKLSKMYEEYFEDYGYRLMSKMARRIIYLIKPKRDTKPKTSPAKDVNQSTDTNSESDDSKNVVSDNNKSGTDDNSDETKALVVKESAETTEKCDADEDKYLNDEDLNNINFHSMLFLMWMLVTMLNIPALLTWARNYKYSMVLSSDTSYHTGFTMSVTSLVTWQIKVPRKNLRHYDIVSALLFKIAVLILAIGPFSLSVVEYGIAFMFTLITVQQYYDVEDYLVANLTQEPSASEVENSSTTVSPEDIDIGDTNNQTTTDNEKDVKSESDEVKEETANECDVENENRLYNVLRNLRDKLSFSNNL